MSEHNFSWSNLSDGIRHNQLFELGVMYSVDYGNSSEEEELLDSVSRIDITLHPHLFGPWRLVLHETQQQSSRYAKWHHHRRGSAHQSLLCDCRQSTL